MKRRSRCPGRFLGIIDQDPSFSKSNELHVDIFRFSLYEVEVNSLSFSAILGNCPGVLNFNQ